MPGKLSPAQAEILLHLGAQGYIVHTNGGTYVDQFGRPISAATVRRLLRLRVLVEDAADTLFAGITSQVIRINRLMHPGNEKGRLW